MKRSDLSLDFRHHDELQRKLALLAFRRQYSLSPHIPDEEIIAAAEAAELRPNICPACFTKHGEQACYGQGCECTCEEAAAHRRTEQQIASRAIADLEAAAIAIPERSPYQDFLEKTVSDFAAQPGQ